MVRILDSGALMNSEAKKLLDQALLLAPADRESLAGELFDSLETDDPGVENAWEAEIDRRVKELDRGEVQPISWADARRMIFEVSDDSD
jgi:putative addiction module component (TIGR02574 family)